MLVSPIAASSGYVASIYAAVNAINHNRDFWTPVYLSAAADAPRQDIGFPGWTITGVPIPPGLYAAVDYLEANGDTDKGFAIYDEELNRWYNLNGVDYSGPTVSIKAAGIFDPTGSGWWNNAAGPYAGRASGGAFAGGMIRPEEMASGVIRHPLAIALPGSLIRDDAYSGYAVAPATTSDGTGAADAIPMGQRFRLDPLLTEAQLRALGLTKAGDLIVARALQTYGAYLVDSALTMAIYYQSGLGTGPSLYDVTHPWPKAVINSLQAMSALAMPALDGPATYGDIDPA